MSKTDEHPDQTLRPPSGQQRWGLFRGRGRSSDRRDVNRDADRDGQAVIETKESSSAGQSPRRTGEATAGRRRRLAPDVAGLVWVAVVGWLVLVPALLHGSYLGAFGLLSKWGLTEPLTGPTVHVHAWDQSDVIQEFLPWTALVWKEVHHGQLPLWNPFSALGLPLAFNWQSAPFSLPMLVAYLFPLSAAYTVQFFVTLFVAGTGAYVLSRWVLNFGVIGAVFAATVFELCGPFIGWLGWPIEALMSWAGWLFAGAILIVRGGRRARHIAFFSICLAFAIFSGEPDACGILLVALGVFVFVLLFLRRTGFGGRQPVLRPLGDMVLALLGGGMLAAPLALPALQLTEHSIRAAVMVGRGVASRLMVHYLLQGFNGIAISGHRWFDTLPSSYYQTSLAYVGVIALVFATLAVMRLWHRRDIVALVVMVAVTATITFSYPVVELLDHIPRIRTVGWHLFLIPSAFGLAVLAGFGMDLFVRWWRDASTRRWAAASFVLWGLVLAGVWFFGRGQLPPPLATIREQSFIWPIFEVIGGLFIIEALWVLARNPQGTAARVVGNAGAWAGAILVVMEAAFLLVSGSSWPSSSTTYFTPTPAVTSLQRTVGSSLVGLGNGLCIGIFVNKAGHSIAGFTPLNEVVGVSPNVNLAYGIDELAAYDPIMPLEYTKAWESLTGQAPGLLSELGSAAWYCPAVKSVSVARIYGVSYILETLKGQAPAGTVFVKRVGDEELYRVPGAARATLTAAPLRGSFPPLDASGTPVKVSQPVPTEWKLTTHASEPTVLRLRLSASPGWHATIDGKPLALSKYAGIMLQAHVPAGSHTIVLHYWPKTLTVGIVLCVLAVFGLAGGISVEEVRRRRRAPPPPSIGQFDPEEPKEVAARELARHS